jgi:TRAP-type C4-dicarboxylate transport system permease small subunit
MLSRTNRALGVAAAALTVVMMVAVLYDVFRRYVLNDPTIWAFDLAGFLLVYLVFLGLPLALQEGSHVAVDIFLLLFRPRLRRALQLIGLALSVVYGAVLTWVVTQYTAQAIQLDWKAVSLVPIPLKYVYAVGPLGALLFTVTAVALIVDFLRGDEAR